jgi:dihydrofolate reductase
MIISLIAAMAENREIGNKNVIPWDIPSDQKHFRAITMGYPVIFGRKTFEIIGRSLPGRRNIVLTHDRNYLFKGAVVAHSIEDAFALCKEPDEIFICGGGRYLTKLFLSHDGFTSPLSIEVLRETLFPPIFRTASEKQRELT